MRRTLPGHVACWKTLQWTSLKWLARCLVGAGFALLRASSKVHRLTVGDYLGPDHGRVTAIHERSIELVELLPDGQGHGWNAREPWC